MALAGLSEVVNVVAPKRAEEGEAVTAPLTGRLARASERPHVDAIAAPLDATRRGKIGRCERLFAFACFALPGGGLRRSADGKRLLDTAEEPDAQPRLASLCNLAARRRDRRG